MNSTFTFALLAAIFFGLSAIPAKRGLSHTDTQTGALISILTVVAVFLISSPWWMRSQDWFTAGFWIFVATGLFHPALSLYFTLVLMGLAMLVLPGQGVLTLLIGISLLDFPGKRKLEKKIVRAPTVHRAIDAIRRRAGQPPLLLPEKNQDLGDDARRNESSIPPQN